MWIFREPAMKTIDILALSMIKGIGNAFIKKNIDQIALSSSMEGFISTSGIVVDDSSETDRLLERAEKILTECQEKGYTVVNISENAYPEQLKAISDPPAVLYLLGNTKLLYNTVAIIGTRNSTNLGNRIAERLGKFFSNYYSICNGLVEGIDAHAIYVDGKILSNVVGVISGGLNYNETCSESHAKTIEDVLNAGGLIVSEFEPSQKEDQYSGSRVSRIQAGLSSGLILVQSSIDGGSKYTVKAFSKLGRTFGFVHYPANREYYTQVFEVNRLISEKGLEGIASFIGQKTNKGLVFASIVKIEKKEDYETFIRFVSSRESMFF